MTVGRGHGHVDAGSEQDAATPGVWGQPDAVRRGQGSNTPDFRKASRPRNVGLRNIEGTVVEQILEVSQGYMPMMWELFNEPFDIRPDGTVHAPERPGLGFTLRPEVLERFKYIDGPEYAF